MGNEKTQYDVVIVGGAMAGATLALALSSNTQGRIKIAVLEKQAPKKHHSSGFDARCIALSDGSCQRFNAIQLANGKSLWQQIQPLSTPITQIHVSDKGHAGLVEFKSDEFGLAQLGAVIELQKTGSILLEAINQYPNIDYIAPVEIDCIDIQENNNNNFAKITLKNDRTLQARLVVGADGTFSQVAQSAGISQNIIQEYQQTAVITNVLVQQAHQGRAFERFTDEGPVALLPMENNLMSLVWCVKEVEPLLKLDDSAFLNQLQQRFGWRLGKLQQCGQRFAYPLNLYQAEQHIQNRVALIGNSVQTLHPIAGQGFNLGIRDVMNLAEIIAQGYLQGIDFGCYSWLEKYANTRENDQQHIMTLTNGLLSVFANNLLPFQVGRNLGLMALSQSSLLRQYFAKPTLGWV
ncbi:2-octaprenyl-6-methoxyphenol hydroxylase /2-octaprenyl-3-methyl-6-methoxy-1,4-benzoquinol hydroxylase [Bisgaardia hudsonensis]|uniref:2-octaprenyl-6-methoxyphenol hydroxylase /2-octaprenyl-3-methyl-6-methoxy-1,4-benzoquinol hydroxylase n=1 Tax=Bisgaardia hudsonensis TaxID=109472 RepID=A0A4R2MYW0_9PAST|nr:2-octaprenyl-6-methoxyphenyl hydroxylase [Bisgaardia hudsonensis]QLB12310.1 2-octaprenyl-6-methoxyphenyl hydroxylase [Bisgaardia hudsonensis]TCP12356.1 2-octaprenyl-6-methoxyphenol hydroxylase /2-octaprenyl-3-methyl-6-methoxy-1,4-benzoquinol hydroxylase [Bisgaardia hudsonensis]